MGNRTGIGQSGVLYPWLEWLKRGDLILTQGKDFNCLPHSMSQQLRNAAFRHNYRVSIDVYSDGIIAKCVKQRTKSKRGKMKTS